ncbi:MAG: 50S ribosomal protein L30 [Desulfovibrio sp.]|nr:50S ribosomal protein L30 [Desulfovibrio sp.]MCA1985993.1 50S ribosomal protein L30 [Desulfovibrio sp.]
MLAITLKKSPIGSKPAQRATLKALGLRKLNDTRAHEDTPSIRGMINRVVHLVEVESHAS